MSSVYVPKALRRQVAEQARYRCGYCLTHQNITGTPMEMDHIFPSSLGGQTVEDNLWLACGLCNEHKGNRVTAQDPRDGRLVRLFHPRLDAWEEHFEWIEGGLRIGGRTAIGRATVNALHLNRTPLVTARQGWIAVGWHPPRT